MINPNELYSVIEDLVQVGFMQAVKSYEPAQDRIRKTEVKKWLKMMRIDEKTFNKLCEKERIKPFRVGSGKNSPLFFSKKDIKQAVVSTKVVSILINNELNK